MTLPDDSSADPSTAAPSKKGLRFKLVVLGVFVVLLVGLAAAWSWSPLKSWLDVDRVVVLLQQVGAGFGPVAATLVFAAALTLAVPLVFLTLVTVVAFGPWAGFLCTMAGAQLGALASYGLGLLLGRDVVRRMGGKKVNAVSQKLAERGLLAVIAVRMVPIAPFAVVNMVAGASHIRLRDLLLGTFLGMTPGSLAIAFFVDQIVEALRQPSQAGMGLVVLTLVLIIAGIWGAKTWLGRQKPVD